MLDIMIWESIMMDPQSPYMSLYIPLSQVSASKIIAMMLGGRGGNPNVKRTDVETLLRELENA